MTSMTTFSAPGTSLKSSAWVWETERVKVWLWPPKPVNATDALYVPMGSALAVKEPEESETAVTVELVLVLVMVTLAPGMAAPVLSCTVPATRAVSVCADARLDVPSRQPVIAMNGTNRVVLEKVMCTPPKFTAVLKTFLTF